MTPLFDPTTLRYTQAGLDLANKIDPLIREQISVLIRDHGYNWRTVMGPASTPAVDASTYNVCPREFHAVWAGGVMDVCLDRLLMGELNG